MRKQPLPDKAIYQDSLAHVHVDGYGFHWAGAADAILHWLKLFRVTSGTVVDLGCGGGQWLRRLSEESYQTCGIDISESMIRLAKQNSPSSQCICGSFADVEIPRCVCVTSLGEPLNYLCSGPAIRRTMRRVFNALEPGGVFIFDVRCRARSPVTVRETHKSADDWFCHALIEEDFRTGEIVRKITTFRQSANGNFRRDKEIHRLKVFSRAEITEWLRNLGFRVKTARAYGAYRLGPRQLIFICRKP